MIITPVMNFSGNCEDAIHVYEHAFDTKADGIVYTFLESLLRYREYVVVV